MAKKKLKLKSIKDIKESVKKEKKKKDYENKSKFVNTSSGTIFDSINKNALESIKLNVHDSTIQNHIVNTILFLLLKSL